MKKILFLSVFAVGLFANAATLIQCPQRYPNGNALVDGDFLRYQNSNRLKDGDIWRYENGNRIVDGDVWRYKNGNRLVDGDVWRYENGNRLRDGEIIRYESGNHLRDASGFKTDFGQLISGDSYSYSFSSSDGMVVDLDLKKNSELFTITIENSGHIYILGYDPLKGSQPTSITCILDQQDSAVNSFKLETKAASLNIKVKSGFNPVEIRKIILDALNSL
jgi:hypothetical protein